MSEDPILEKNLSNLIKIGLQPGGGDLSRKDDFYQTLRKEWRSIYKPIREFSPVALILLTLLILVGFALWLENQTHFAMSSQLLVMLLPIGGINVMLAPAITIFIILHRRKQNEK